MIWGKNPYFWKHPYHPFLFLLVCRVRLFVTFFSNSVLICTNPPHLTVPQRSKVTEYFVIYVAQNSTGKGQVQVGKRAQGTPTRLVKGNQWVFIVPKNKGPRLFLGGKRGIGGVGTLRFPWLRVRFSSGRRLNQHEGTWHVFKYNLEMINKHWQGADHLKVGKQHAGSVLVERSMLDLYTCCRLYRLDDS